MKVKNDHRNYLFAFRAELIWKISKRKEWSFVWKCFLGSSLNDAGISFQILAPTLEKARAQAPLYTGFFETIERDKYLPLFAVFLALATSPNLRTKTTCRELNRHGDLSFLFQNLVPITITFSGQGLTKISVQVLYFSE